MSEVDDEYKTARRDALRLLSRREYSANEIELRLQKKDHQLDIIYRVIKELQDESLQSDQRFAESYTRFRQMKGFGPVRIEQELKQRGVASIIITATLNATETPWNKKIEQVRQKRFGSTLPIDLKEKARQIKFLQYRGFTQELIQWALSDSDLV